MWTLEQRKVWFRYQPDLILLLPFAQDVCTDAYFQCCSQSKMWLQTRREDIQKILERLRIIRTDFKAMQSKVGDLERKTSRLENAFCKIVFEYQEMIAGNNEVKRCLEDMKMQPQIADLRCFVCGKSFLTIWRLSEHLRLFCHKNNAIYRTRKLWK